MVHRPPGGRRALTARHRRRVVLGTDGLVLEPSRRAARHGAVPVVLALHVIRTVVVHRARPMLAVDVTVAPDDAEPAVVPWRLEFAPGRRRAGRRLANALAARTTPTGGPGESNEGVSPAS